MSENGHKCLAWCQPHAENPILAVKSCYYDYYFVVLIIRVPPNSPQIRLLLRKAHPSVSLPKGKWVMWAFVHRREAGLCPGTGFLRQVLKGKAAPKPWLWGLRPSGQSKHSSSTPRAGILSFLEGNREEWTYCMLSILLVIFLIIRFQKSLQGYSKFETEVPLSSH